MFSAGLFLPIRLQVMRPRIDGAKTNAVRLYFSCRFYKISQNSSRFTHVGCYAIRALLNTTLQSSDSLIYAPTDNYAGSLAAFIRLQWAICILQNHCSVQNNYSGFQANLHFRKLNCPQRDHYAVITSLSLQVTQGHFFNFFCVHMHGFQ